MPFVLRPKFHPLFLALSLATATPLALADSVGELRALVDANDAAAWDMAARMEPENAGDPEFDFWYGLAAKAAGEFNQALFAFERVVLAQPGNARAKIELADSHFRVGNEAESRRLFEEVLATTPPDPVQQRIRTYLSAMEAVRESRGTRVTGQLSIAAGHDSNVSSATDVVDHDINIAGGVRTIALMPLSLETDAAFAEFRAALDVVTPVNQRVLRFLNVSAQRRDNEDLLSGGNFDYSALGLTGGWMVRRGPAAWRIPFSVQGLWAESESIGIANDDRYTFSAGLEYSHPLSARTAMTWFGQLGNSHFPSEENRNIWQARLGAAHAWSATDVPLRLSTMLVFGTEPTEESGPAAEPNC